MPGPVCSAACSVDSPISHASGMSESAERTKSATSPGWRARATATVTGARDNDAQRNLRPTTGVAYPAVLEAVLFDWGDTLMRWDFDRSLLEAGHRAGLDAIGVEPRAELTSRFVEEYLPGVFAPEVLAEVDYPGLVRQLLAEVGVEVGDHALEAFLEAEHHAWAPARRLGSTTHALLEALRDRGLALGLVSNALDPPRLLHGDLEEFGVAERLDAAVFSSEVGWRKPHPAIFERALTELGVEPARALMVGDRLREDVGGAAALGMATCQALWFRAEEAESGPEADFRAFAQMDVVTVVDGLS